MHPHLFPKLHEVFQLKSFRVVALRRHKDPCMLPDAALDFSKVRRETTDARILAALYLQLGLNQIWSAQPEKDKACRLYSAINPFSVMQSVPYSLHKCNFAALMQVANWVRSIVWYWGRVMRVLTRADAVTWRDCCKLKQVALGLRHLQRGQQNCFRNWVILCRINHYLNN